MSDDEPDITITVEFGDEDPEDAYDAGDDPLDNIAVMERVVTHLRQHRDERFEARRQEALRVVAVLGVFRERNISRRVDEIRNALEEMG